MRIDLDNPLRRDWQLEVHDIARQTGDTVEQYLRTAQTRQAVFGRAGQSLRGGD